MFSPFSLILLPIGYFFLWPLVAHLRPNQSPFENGITTLALSSGLLALGLFWLGLLPGAFVTSLSTLLIVAGGTTLGVVLNSSWFSPRRWVTYWRAQWRRMTNLDFNGLLMWALLAIAVILIVNALYYPFVGEDVLVRYAPQAQTIYTQHRIPNNLYGYPPLVPLGFVATWFAAGVPNEHLARLFPTVLALGTLGATYLIGRYVYGHRAGMLAAVIAGFTPFFVQNATLAYTDIPAAFPLTLGMYYGLRWWKEQDRTHALLAGTLLGVALLTKQSALIWLASLGALPLGWLIATCRTEISERWQQALLALGAMLLLPLLIAGPWYARNGVLTGWSEVLPLAGLYHLRGPRAGWQGILPPLVKFDAFGWITGGLITAGWITGIANAIHEGWRLLKGQGSVSLPHHLLLAAGIIPYWLAWWTTFSFDVRFLLLIVPLMAIWALDPLLWIIGQMSSRMRLPRPAWQAAGMLLLVVGLFFGARERLGSIYYIVTQPFLSEETRFQQAQPVAYGMVTFAQENLDPATDCLYLMDQRLAYYLDDFEVHVGYPQKLEDLAGCDYLFHSSSFWSIYADGRLGWQNAEFYQHVLDPEYFEEVYRVNGVRVMRILPAIHSAGEGS